MPIIVRNCGGCTCGSSRFFGSYARDEGGEESDLDFIVDFDRKSFDNYMDLKAFLESLFDKRVDLVLLGAIKPRLRDSILREAVHAA